MHCSICVQNLKCLWWIGPELRPGQARKWTDGLTDGRTDYGVNFDFGTYFFLVLYPQKISSIYDEQVRSYSRDKFGSTHSLTHISPIMLLYEKNNSNNKYNNNK